MKSAIPCLKKSYKECNSRGWISTTRLIKWSDLICMQKLTAYDKQTNNGMIVFAHHSNLSEKELEFHTSWDGGRISRGLKYISRYAWV